MRFVRLEELLGVRGGRCRLWRMWIYARGTFYKSLTIVVPVVWVREGTEVGGGGGSSRTFFKDSDGQLGDRDESRWLRTT